MHAFRNLSSPTIITAQSPLPAAPLQILPQGLSCPLSQIDSAPLFDVSQLEPFVPEPQRIPRHFREIRYVQGEPGKVRNIVKRLPTPPQQIIERVNVIPAPQPIINYTQPTFIQQAIPAPAPRLIAQPAPQLISQPAAFVQQPFGRCCNNAFPVGSYFGY